MEPQNRVAGFVPCGFLQCVEVGLRAIEPDVDERLGQVLIIERKASELVRRQHVAEVHERPRDRGDRDSLVRVTSCGSSKCSAAVT